MVEGTVHRVTFKSESGYTVLKVNAVHVSGKPADAAARSAAPSSARKGGATRNIHLTTSVLYAHPPSRMYIWQMCGKRCLFNRLLTCCRLGQHCDSGWQFSACRQGAAAALCWALGSACQAWNAAEGYCLRGGCSPVHRCHSSLPVQCPFRQGHLYPSLCPCNVPSFCGPHLILTNSIHPLLLPTSSADDFRRWACHCTEYGGTVWDKHSQYPG